MSRSLEERVITLVAAIAHLSEDEVQLETTYEDLGLDSLDEVELAMDLEEELDCDIIDEDFKDINTVQGLVDLAKRLTTESA